MRKSIIHLAESAECGLQHRSLTYAGHSGEVTTVAWSPDGTYIASGSSDMTVQVWYAATGDHIFTYKGHADKVNTVAWSPDGKYIASGSADGVVQVWKALMNARNAISL